MSSSSALVGNSSSGLLEAPSLGVPIINVGSRQDGRIRAESIVDSGPDPDSVRAAFAKIKNPEFQDFARRVVNPLRGVAPSRTIVSFIKQTEFSVLAPKKFIDWEPHVDS